MVMASSSSSFSLASTPVCNASTSETNSISCSSPIDEPPVIASNEVAPESTFNTGGRVPDPYWSSLSPTTVQALICTQNWLRSKVKNNLQNLVDDIEDIEADVLGGVSENTFDEN
ncbi:putative zinc finger BED domain-containing protein RICESLEEPER 2-like [Iris pallida]|uniref:Zinc finger BED domain-containing protein RICESLEEPER 2-like n=1 Tax=Iris pallida TaxID=29817 RepID=A0AAX6HFT4_IRIPA|nr:putative zinc finger BED domain-containing protein RICESLEEPER 2-like [Iris pallida]